MSKNKTVYPSARAYLASLTPPLAKLNGRGRFSKDAIVALKEAKDKGITFGDESLGNLKPAAARRRSAAAGSSQDSAKIRRWAKKNGYMISKQGRLPIDVVRAYNGMDPKPKRDDFLAKPVPKNPRLRQLECLYGLTDDGYRVGFSTCRRCALHINRCTCSAPLPPSIVVEIIDFPTPWV